MSDKKTEHPPIEVVICEDCWDRIVPGAVAINPLALCINCLQRFTDDLKARTEVCYSKKETAHEQH